MRKFLACVVFLAVALPQLVAAELPDAPSASREQTARIQAAKFAASQKSATVVLKDSSKRTGKISDVTDTGFVLVESTGYTRRLSFEQVLQVKRKGLHPAVKAAIIAGAVLGGLTILGESISD